MNDKELLEKAAKAAGIDWIKGCVWIENGFYAPHSHERIAWNPLTNSADAFELAVALRMDVMVQDSDARTAVALLTPFTDHLVEHEEPHGSDAFAATRRAITTAAAMSATYEEDLT